MSACSLSALCSGCVICPIFSSSVIFARIGLICASYEESGFGFVAASANHARAANRRTPQERFIITAIAPYLTYAHILRSTRPDRRSRGSRLPASRDLLRRPPRPPLPSRPRHRLLPRHPLRLVRRHPQPHLQGRRVLRPMVPPLRPQTP